MGKYRLSKLHVVIISGLLLITAFIFHLLGKVFLTSGMLIHELSVLIVVVNAVRLVRYKQQGPKIRRGYKRKLIPETN